MSKMEELRSKLHKKAWEVKHDASWKLQLTSEWIRNNRDVIIAAIPIAAAAVSGTTKIVSKAIARGNLKKGSKNYENQITGKHRKSREQPRI